MVQVLPLPTWRRRNRSRRSAAAGVKAYTEVVKSAKGELTAGAMPALLRIAARREGSRPAEGRRPQRTSLLNDGSRLRRARHRRTPRYCSASSVAWCAGGLAESAWAVGFIAASLLAANLAALFPPVILGEQLRLLAASRDCVPGSAAADGVLPSLFVETARGAGLAVEDRVLGCVFGLVRVSRWW